MIASTFALRPIFSLLAIPTLLWHVSADGLTQEEFANSFRLTPAGRGGTCQRDASTSTGMQNSLGVVLQAADDAWDLASNAWVDMDKFGDDTAAAKVYRGLLFVFFGITFTHDIESESFEFNALDGSAQYYEYVRSMSDSFNDYGKHVKSDRGRSPFRDLRGCRLPFHRARATPAIFLLWRRLVYIHNTSHRQ